MVEMLIATAVLLVVMASVFGVLNPVQGAFHAQPEVADLQQRLRVAQETLYRDLMMAGAGTAAGPLVYAFAPIVPFRRGVVGGAGPGTFRDDTLTLVYIPPRRAQTTTSQMIAGGASPVTLALNEDAGCPVGAPLCGFSAGDTVLVFDGTGNYDTFKMTNVGGATGTMSLNRSAASAVDNWPAGSRVVQAVSRTYYLNAATRQLMSYDGSSNADVPVADHVVGLTFAYFGEPQPPVMRNALRESPGPWTTYGPAPPDGTQQGTFPVGENCTFAVDAHANPVQVPRLAALGSGSAPVALVRLNAAQLTDGPWCPDADHANRWDADLLRVRAVRVTIRVEAALDALRGPAGYLFTNGGTSRGGVKWVPDQTITFDVSPRNLNLGR